MLFLFVHLQQSSFQSDIEDLNSRLEEEKVHTGNLQGEMNVAKCKLQEDMFRTRGTLLMDIISMQLFYALKELSLDDSRILPENELNCKDAYTHCAATKSKFLENTDLLLEMLKSYLNVMNSKGETLLENSGGLRSLIGSAELFDERTLLRDTELIDEKTLLRDTELIGEKTLLRDTELFDERTLSHDTELFDERTILRDTEEVSLYMANKTDDDKVVASSRCNETPFESCNEDLIPSTEETLRDSDEYSILRDKLVSLKNCIDGEALDFLKKAFEFDVESENKITESRQDIYKRIQECMEQRNSVLGQLVKLSASLSA